MNDLEFVMLMVNEACKSHSSSYHVMCVEDEHERYIMCAEWVDGAPSICIMHEDANRVEVYLEVSDISDTDAIKELISEWHEIEEIF